MIYIESNLIGYKHSLYLEDDELKKFISYKCTELVVFKRILSKDITEICLKNDIDFQYHGGWHIYFKTKNDAMKFKLMFS